MFDARPPFAIRDTIDVFDAPEKVNIGDQFITIDAKRGNRIRKAEVSVNVCRLPVILAAGMRDKKARINRDAEGLLCIHAVQRGTPDVKSIIPGIPQDPSGGGGLTQHRQGRLPASQTLQQLDQHPF